MNTTPAHPLATVTATAGSALPAALARGASDLRRAAWQVERELWAPRTFVATDTNGSVLGAALTAARPYSAYRKIVDVFADHDAVWAQLVEAARDDSVPLGGNIGGIPANAQTRPTPIAVHFEERLADAPLTPTQRAALTAAGFVPAQTPVPSIPSTRPGDPSQSAAWSWWRGSVPQHNAPYYGQTTEVTCGAVAALTALEQRGNDTFSPESLVENRAAEIAFWRRATNLPACEPVGLAVETAKLGRDSNLLADLPRVILSTSEPVLIEEFSSNESERMLRADLQLESLRQAEKLGLSIERRWIEVSEIFELVRGGAQVLLLIDLTELIADPTPHWVLAQEVIDDTLLISDPWVHYPNGETWVDTFALPLPASSIDRITRWGDPAYRGVIVLSGN